MEQETRGFWEVATPEVEDEKQRLGFNTGTLSVLRLDPNASWQANKGYITNLRQPAMLRT